MIPEGYEKLAVIGMTYKGEYNPNETYMTLNTVYYNGSTYVALKDNPIGTPENDGANWQYVAKGFLESLISATNATDTYGLLGTSGTEVNAQDLLDVIADRVANKLFEKNRLVNNGLTTEAGYALDARYGKNLADELAKLNSDKLTIIRKRITGGTVIIDATSSRIHHAFFAMIQGEQGNSYASYLFQGYYPGTTPDGSTRTHMTKLCGASFTEKNEGMTYILSGFPTEVECAILVLLGEVPGIR